MPLYFRVIKYQRWSKATSNKNYSNLKSFIETLIDKFYLLIENIYIYIHNKVLSEKRKIENIPADAVTDLKTTNNKLSIWKIENKENAKEVALAYNTAPTKSDIETVYLVIINPHYIDENKLEVEKSKGNTLLINNNNNNSEHYDLNVINYKILGKIAYYIQQQIIDGQYIIVSKKEILQMVAMACKNKRLDIDKLGYKDSEKVTIRKLL